MAASVFGLPEARPVAFIAFEPPIHVHVTIDENVPEACAKIFRNPNPMIKTTSRMVGIGMPINLLRNRNDMVVSV